MTASLTACLANILGTQLGRRIEIQLEQPVGGGSINDCFRLDTNAGPFFVKLNAADRFPSMFEAEADGLRRLAATGAIRVPRIIAIGEEHDVSFLLMEHLDSGLKGERFWEGFGRRLAAVHRHSASSFGLDRDNYIGSLRQTNTPASEWPAFFIHQRLEPQLKMAHDRKRVEVGMAFRFERLFARLHDLFPPEPPALLHGDLWSGNFLSDASGQPVLIDPAVYYGHREMDIAMTRLFGGFEPGFYAVYNDAWPMERGWEERMDLCNLYPLLVHVNLFGGGYAAQVEAVLRRFV
ncbi:MAG TPA: fructosamine kinase family protein [Flavobacteriales bacterium]|nr:fructosamine kinase family protein [Flavobacteriales bacterium]